MSKETMDDYSIGSGDDEWTHDELVRLRRACLYEVDENLDKNERWKRISNLVGNKTKRECRDRWKVIRKHNHKKEKRHKKKKKIKKIKKNSLGEIKLNKNNGHDINNEYLSLYGERIQLDNSLYGEKINTLTEDDISHRPLKGAQLGHFTNHSQIDDVQVPHHLNELTVSRPKSRGARHISRLNEEKNNDLFQPSHGHSKRGGPVLEKLDKLGFDNDFRSALDSPLDSPPLYNTYPKTKLSNDLFFSSNNSHNDSPLSQISDYSRQSDHSQHSHRSHRSQHSHHSQHSQHSHNSHNSNLHHKQYPSSKSSPLGVFSNERNERNHENSKYQYLDDFDDDNELSQTNSSLEPLEWGNKSGEHEPTSLFGRSTYSNSRLSEGYGRPKTGYDRNRRSKTDDLEMVEVEDDIDGDVDGWDNDSFPSTSLYSNDRIQRKYMANSEALNQNETRLISQLLFNSTRRNTLPETWSEQGFFPENLSGDLGYGICQLKGGPCGIIASVQAYMLKHLLFHNNQDEHYLHSNRWKSPNDNELKNALINALTEIVWNCTDKRYCYVVILNRTNNARTHEIYFQSLSKIKIFSEDDLKEFYNSQIHTYMEKKGAGVFHLLVSVLLTRGLHNIQDDMTLSDDIPLTPLIGEHNYASQELVNLLLIGKAVGNVFDGNKEIENNDDDSVLVLKGVSHRSDIGFLTLFEHYEHVQVGRNYKCPRYPIWVICSESHYSVLFSTNKRLTFPASRCPDNFDIYYFDGLARQDEEIKLTLDINHNRARSDDNMIPPIEFVLRTKWHDAEIDWNGTEPLL